MHRKGYSNYLRVSHYYLLKTTLFAFINAREHPLFENGYFWFCLQIFRQLVP